MTKIDGINAHVPDKNWLQKASKLGISWVRIDLNWNAIEPRNGSFNFGQIDTAVNEAKRLGLRVYASMAYTPSWINSDYRATPTVSHWTRFVTKVAQRYGGKIDVYGLWNEPNLKQFYHGTMSEYRDVIMKPGYAAIKAVNLNLVVAAGELASTSNSDWPEWCNMLYKNHMNFDVVGFHTYQDNASSVVNRFTMGKAWIFGWLIPYYRPYNFYLGKLRDKGKRIFLSEVGWEAKQSSSKEQKHQKECIVNLMKHKKSLKVEAVFIYDLHDDPNALNHPWGIFNTDGSPKQAAAALMA